MNLFLELSFVLLVTTIVSITIKFLKQPLIIGYLISGIICGPFVLNLLRSGESLEIFSKIGISILLFVVGINLNPKIIKEVGKVSLITGFLQVTITSYLGYHLSTLIGLSHLPALYTSITLTFSSTIIILKLLGDKGDLQKLYGKIATGILLVQDFVASLILLFVSSTANNQSLHWSSITIKVLGAIFIIILLSKYLLPKITMAIAPNPELLFLFSLSWGLCLGACFYLLGFSIEIGSLIAGVSLSSSPLSFEISSRLKPVRDFFVVIFFVLLGSNMNFYNLTDILPKAVILSIFVLFINPLIVIFILNLQKYKTKTSFLTGLTVAQISEFSLILATLGYNLKHISQQNLSLITLVGIITIATSSYFIMHSDKIFNILEPFLKKINLQRNNAQQNTKEIDYDTLLFGYDRVGKHFTNHFKKKHHSFLVVDYDPQREGYLNQQNIPFRLGDASDIDFIEDLTSPKLKLIISTIPDFNTNILLLREFRKNNTQTTFVTISHNHQEAKKLYENGASFVSIPHYLGAKHITNILNKYGSKHSNLKNERDKHINYLQKILL